jgi:hypothetical protein
VIVIRTRKSPSQARAAIANLMPSLASEVMNGAVINFSKGKNAKGASLKRPKRLKWGYGGGGATTGIKNLLSSSGFNVGGPGIDTGTLFKHLGKRRWFKSYRYGSIIDPQIGVSGTRPDGIPLITYFETYRDECAHGRLTGLNAKIKAGIERRIRSAL